MKQWRSQDIAVARAHYVPAQTAEAFRGSGAFRSQKIMQPPMSVLRPYRSVVYVTRVQWACETRNSVYIHSDAGLLDFKTV